MSDKKNTTDRPHKIPIPYYIEPEVIDLDAEALKIIQNAGFQPGVGTPKKIILNAYRHVSKMQEKKKHVSG